MTLSPTLLLIVLLGAVVGAGLVLLVRAVVGVEVDDRVASAPSSLTARLQASGRMVPFAVLAFLLVLLLTRWLVLAVACGLLVLFWDRLFGGARAARQGIARIEGLAAWTESLRDTVAGAVGLEQAIPRDGVRRVAGDPEGAHRPLRPAAGADAAARGAQAVRRGPRRPGRRPDHRGADPQRPAPRPGPPRRARLVGPVGAARARDAAARQRQPRVDAAQRADRGRRDRPRRGGPGALQPRLRRALRHAGRPAGAGLHPGHLHPRHPLAAGARQGRRPPSGSSTSSGRRRRDDADAGDARRRPRRRRCPAPCLGGHAAAALRPGGAGAARRAAGPRPSRGGADRRPPALGGVAPGPAPRRPDRRARRRPGVEAAPGPRGRPRHGRPVPRDVLRPDGRRRAARRRAPQRRAAPVRAVRLRRPDDPAVAGADRRGRRPPCSPTSACARRPTTGAARSGTW
ncbi:hypothetical protein [Nocardioides sp. TF02-7]|uniref:hypothetical protein n=1 Tax=Nocardioides sp. TF02-7 TaxID=2917724 RepID=UPI001F05CDEE|nr:hypothetical protein [Nocardioides sp. TF02-7]UMG93301.1 hypothetical protein MF408_03200 [Nocardioides sp. TF02-7]